MFIRVGQIVGVWGIKGAVKLHSYTREREDIAQYDTWFLSADNSKSKGSDILNAEYSDPLSCHTITDCRRQGKGLVAFIEGCETPEQAATHIGRAIFIQADDLPELDAGEYYWHQLIGLEIHNQEGPFGVVKSMLETGANDVFVVALNANLNANRSEALVPNIKSIVVDVDLANQRIMVDWDWRVLDD